ncbi:DDB1- and CUL4-associated factor 4-like protein [Dinothrombium tinctorium]|uniref:DDB1-and CUL4-associated factor 4-like protein n=1 Tax=Dinothrombium tinctorium TaxID=1965070 RepID=A0A443QNR5_9ACAR|nr:DDB1- and CUL4-associated factor 4-like protein [Dinothrombium tinctorium]
MQRCRCSLSSGEPNVIKAKANECIKEMEIEGFYFDAEKKRYFRIIPGNNRHNPLTERAIRVKKARIENRSVRVTSGNSSLFVPRVFSSQQIDLMNDYNGFTFQECVLHSRLASMRKRKSLSLNLYNYRGDPLKNGQCEYMIGKPEHDLLIATWKNDDGYILERISVSKTLEDQIPPVPHADRHIVNAFPPGNKVADFEVGSDPSTDYDVIMCLANHLKPDSTFCSLGIYFESRDANRRLFIADHNLNFEFHEIFYSCSGILPHTFAIGGENVIRLFKPFTNSTSRNFEDHTSFKLKGIVSSLKFDSSGKSFFAGLNKGRIHRFDVNTKKEAQKIDMKTRSVVFIHPLQNERQLIASCHENNLLLVDLRMPSQYVLSYREHINDCKKIPVSVDESVDVLCCQGQDSITRMWSIKSGKLLHSFAPASDDESMHCVWFSHSWKCSDREPKPVLYGAKAENLDVFF